MLLCDVNNLTLALRKKSYKKKWDQFWDRNYVTFFIWQILSNQMEKQQQQHRLFSLICSAWVSINLEDPGVIIGAGRDGTEQDGTKH